MTESLVLVLPTSPCQSTQVNYMTTFTFYLVLSSISITTLRMRYLLLELSNNHGPATSVLYLLSLKPPRLDILEVFDRLKQQHLKYTYLHRCQPADQLSVQTVDAYTIVIQFIQTFIHRASANVVTVHLNGKFAPRRGPCSSFNRRYSFLACGFFAEPRRDGHRRGLRDHMQLIHHHIRKSEDRNERSSVPVQTSPFVFIAIPTCVAL